jgi:hypothetical protein
MFAMAAISCCSWWADRRRWSCITTLRRACLGYSNPAFISTVTAVLGSDGTTMTATMTARCVANPGVILGGPFTMNFVTNADGTISDDASGATFWNRGP